MKYIIIIIIIFILVVVVISRTLLGVDILLNEMVNYIDTFDI